MNEKQEILSAAERRDLAQKATFYEDLGFPVLAPMIAKLRAQLAADDLARLQMEATQRTTMNNMATFICDNCGTAALAANRGADCPCGGTYSMDLVSPVIINLTPHVIRLNDGTEYPPSGVVARVSAEYKVLATHPNCYEVVYGEVTGLPAHQDGVDYIVSGMVAAACPGRGCLLVPATGHPDAVRRDGQVYSVPGFIV